MAIYEIITALLAVVLTMPALKLQMGRKRILNKNSVILILGMLPIALLSVNMVSDTITVDELQYMNVIVDMRNIMNNPSAAEKLMYQYRTSQMVFGTIFNLIPRKLFAIISYTNLIIIYKMLHWILFYSVGAAIAGVVNRYYIQPSE